MSHAAITNKIWKILLSSVNSFSTFLSVSVFFHAVFYFFLHFVFECIAAFMCPIYIFSNWACK